MNEKKTTGILSNGRTLPYLMTAMDAAAYTGVSVNVIRKLVRDGRLRANRITGCRAYYLYTDEMLAYFGLEGVGA